MPGGPIRDFSHVQSEAEVDAYLIDLFKTPKNRSMEVVHQHAQQITDWLWRLRYINRGKRMLDEYEKTAKGKPSSS